MIISLAIGVDDTGGEGEQFLSRSVDAQRRTLVAAVMERGDRAEFSKQWKLILADARTVFPKAVEFHASALWNRQGDYKVAGSAGKAAAIRIFTEISQLVARYGVVFYAQTVHDETYAALLHEFDPATNSGFDLHEEDANALYDCLNGPVQHRKLAAFLLLAGEVAAGTRRIVQETLGALPDELRIDAAWEIDRANDFKSVPKYAERLIARNYWGYNAVFADSANSTMVQLADFGAYVLNRHQYIMANRENTGATVAELFKLRKKDLEFLEATKSCTPHFINVLRANVPIDLLHHEAYDTIIDAYRRRALALQPLQFGKVTV